MRKSYLAPTVVTPSLLGPPIIGLPPDKAKFRSTPASTLSDNFLQYDVLMVPCAWSCALAIQSLPLYRAQYETAVSGPWFTAVRCQTPSRPRARLGVMD